MTLALSAPLFAQAHHVMDGKTPASFSQGLLSGIAHPVIGVDHLVAILAMGAVASLSKRSVTLIAVFFASLLLGVGLHLARLNLPMAELGVALALVACGALILRAPAVTTTIAAIVFAIAGVFGGYAYGESIVGAEASPLGAYLLGLVIVQSVLALAAGRVFQLVRRERPMQASRASVLSGVFTMLVGVAFAFLA
jgi:urease accessory protein